VTKSPTVVNVFRNLFLTCFTGSFTGRNGGYGWAEVKPLETAWDALGSLE
jgi:hypothetical protein